MRERKNGLLQQAVDNLTDAPDARQDGQETVKNIDVWFQDFWRVYPLKIGKKRALAAWRKLKPRNRGEVELILGDIRARMQQDYRWLDGYIPHPTTYINQRRWEEDVPTAKPRCVYTLYTEDLNTARAQFRGLEELDSNQRTRM